MDYIGPVTTVALFLVVAIGSLIIWELRKIHARIDKYSGKMDKHIEEGVKVHTACFPGATGRSTFPSPPSTASWTSWFDFPDGSCWRHHGSPVGGA